MINKFIDLHIHLDGSINLKIAKELAKIQNITLPEDKVLEKKLKVSKDCKSLNEFLSCFELPLKLLQTYDSLKLATYLVCEDLDSQNVKYAEIRYAPCLHTKNGMSQEDAIKAVLEGIKESKLKANVILCLMRGLETEEENEETVLLAKKYLKEDDGVVAIDLAGAEGIYKTRNYEKLFNKAKDLGIPFTIHAGEADGADSVKEAISYGAKRIGHGVRINEDEKVVSLVLEKGIFLEMCPTSNMLTKAVKDMEKYPFKEYLEKGIKVTINTDDPAIEGTTIKEEFEYIADKFDLNENQIKTIIKNSIEASFTSNNTKENLRKEFNI